MPLPPAVERSLEAFVKAAQSAFGTDLVSIVLFGSAAEDRLRPTSDVNVIVVLRAFDAAQAEALAPAAAQARAAVQMRSMFVLQGEIDACAHSFAAKFGDIARRHRVLHGSDPFARIEIARSRRIEELRQLLLNLVLRMRAGLVASIAHEERLTARIIEASGPLRVAAATLVALEDGRTLAPREAFREVAERLQGAAGVELAELVTRARVDGALPPGQGAPMLASFLALAQALHARAEELR